MFPKWETNNLQETKMEKAENIVEKLKVDADRIIGVEGLKFSIEPHEPELLGGWRHRPDFIAGVSFEGQAFKLIGEFFERRSSSVFEDKISQLKLFKDLLNKDSKVNFLPFLVSSYLSPSRRQKCKEEGVFFLDLSGNVYLKHGGLNVEREGFRNLFPEKRSGRSPFSDKASLILRVMLDNADKFWGVLELAQVVGLSPGFVSKMVKELEKRHYVASFEKKLKLKNPESILEDWIHDYNYKKNREFKYFCLAKGPEDIMEKLRAADVPEDIGYVLSLQAGANLVSPHSIYNEVHLYVSSKDDIDFFSKELNLKQVERGANLIFLLPYYRQSVFFGKQKVKDLWVASNVQLYLDLYNYPVRGLEQAEHLYDRRLKKLFEGKEA